MPADIPDAIPESYEILKIIDTSGPANEYLARHKTDDILVRLRMFSLDQTSSVTTQRHLREYLRCDITFMEEIELAGVVRVFDYSDTKNLIWVATQPAEVDKLSERFDFLKSQSFKFRQALVHQFLNILQQIHNSRVVHRNLSSETIFLSAESNIYIGDFGIATYASNQSTRRQDTISVHTIGYMPPELRNAETFSCDVSCDLFSAGLLAFEILSAEPLPKDAPSEIHQILSARLNDQISKGIIGADTAETILKATNPSPQKRWLTIEDFSSKLEKSLQDTSPYKSISAESTSTVAISKPSELAKTTDIDVATDMAQELTEPAKPTVETTTEITPLDPSHEIWNNRYEILKKIGEGGQAVVYRAYDHLTNEEIAIKTIWSRHQNDRSAINRLKQGAMIARSLTHPYIIKTYSVEQRIDADGTSRYVFICMELIKSGLELSDVIDARRAEGKKFRLDETLHIIRQLLDALKYAHGHTIHRDIKPGNIMLVPCDDQNQADSNDLTKFNIRLIDFGIAKVLSQKHIDVTGKGFRSAHYGAPELADTKTGVDARADIYSVGVIMYQMLTGNLPRKSSPPANKANKEVSASLAKVIDKVINADREKRFKSVSALIKEIERAVSKFNWLRKAAKIAAVVLLVICLGIAVKYFIPEPDELPVQSSIEILKARIPDEEIAAFDNDSAIKYTDIEGYNLYDSMRKEALADLQKFQSSGYSKIKRSYPSWKEQEKVWLEIEPAVEKVNFIAKDKREYDARKNIAIAGHLIKLEPSLKIIEEVKDKVKRTEELLKVRPLKQDNLSFCRDTYDLGAKVFMNIANLAGGSDTPQTAEAINEKLRSVEDMRNNFLSTRSSLDTIEQLKDYDFQAKSDKCLKKADRDYQSFALVNAEKYFNLLNQICGTIAYVRDEVNFKRSDIGLISSRLMDLCHDDIETFENYPTWKEKLKQVYERKEIFGKYMLIHTFLSKYPKDVPQAVYDLTVSAKTRYEEGNLNSANAQLIEAAEKYKKFVRNKINDLKSDCDSLGAFSFVSAENIQRYKGGLAKLSESTNTQGWLKEEFIDDYSRLLAEIKNEKNIVREQLTNQAVALKKKIIDSKDKAQQKNFFWESMRIKEYISVAQQYDTDQIEASIKNWKYVDNFPSLSSIINQMKNVNASLEKMLKRKDQLDRLANDIDRGITFCGKFKGTSSDEREKYKKWESELKGFRAKLTMPRNHIYLIDQTEGIFAAEHKNILSGSSEILAELPYHKSRVIELVNKTHSLEKSAGYINECQMVWADVLGQLNVSQIKPNLSGIRTYLESIKQDVDDWSAEKFNKQIQDKCKIIADTLNEQNRAITTIITAVSDEKSRLVEAIESFEKKVSEILNDEDIRTLDNISGNNRQQAFLKFKQLPTLLTDIKQKFSKIILSNITTSADIIHGGISTSFEIDDWFIEFYAQEDQLDNQISKTKALEDKVPIFRETRETLEQQSSMETNYYLSLRDYTIGFIDYSDIGNKINALETDANIVKMCNFLVQTGNKTIPRLEMLKTSLISVTQELTSLESAKINTLSGAKDFNVKRKQILSRITSLQQEVAKFNRTNLENSCKQSVVHTVDKIKNLLGNANQTDALNNLASLLWTFFPDHKDWSQWISFLELYHITVSDEGIRLSSSDHLRVVNEQGDDLTMADIAANPTKVFYANAGNSANFGWPLYISHQKDPTAVLAFIPQSVSGDIKSFYMAIREITNTQYKLFLEEIGAKPTIKLAGWAHFGDQKGNLLIGQAVGQFPPSRINWDKSAGIFVIDEKFEHAPVTWVTFYGAQVYAQWLNTELPTTSQYSYAARGGTTTMYPWGDELPDISSYGHVRSAVWQEAARKYNSKRDDPVEIAYPPIGAIKDFVKGKAINPDKIAHSNGNDYPVWPCFTKNKPNTWGLYDMIGNAWEWCVDKENDTTPTICGGSCLCPPEYLSPESKYRFKAQACDVGFRIIKLVK